MVRLLYRQAKMSTAIRWFEKAEFDTPQLNSPQPCIHGAGCVFTVKGPDGAVLPGCCRFVHPGEEGTGRRLFPERTINDAGPDGNGKFTQPACVRLVGNAGFYERQRLKMPWQAWCVSKGIPFTPNVPGTRRAPVERIPIGGPRFAGGAAPAPRMAPKPAVGEVEALRAEMAELRNLLAVASRGPPAYPARGPAPVRGRGGSRGGPRGRGGAAPQRGGAPAAKAAVAQRDLEEELLSAAGGGGGGGGASVWQSSRTGEQDDDTSFYDNCDYCKKPVEDCPERGDHGDEMRDRAHSLQQ